MDSLSFKAAQVGPKNVVGHSDVTFGDGTVCEVSNCGFCKEVVARMHNNVLHLASVLSTFEIASCIVIGLILDGGDE